MQLCVGCTDFARYVDCLYLCEFCTLSGLFVRIHILCVKRLCAYSFAQFKRLCVGCTDFAR